MAFSDASDTVKAVGATNFLCVHIVLSSRVELCHHQRFSRRAGQLNRTGASRRHRSVASVQPCVNDAVTPRLPGKTHRYIRTGNAGHPERPTASTGH
jgi:hypothetical protein